MIKCVSLSFAAGAVRLFAWKYIWHHNLVLYSIYISQCVFLASDYGTFHFPSHSVAVHNSILPSASGRPLFFPCSRAEHIFDPESLGSVSVFHMDGPQRTSWSLLMATGSLFVQMQSQVVMMLLTNAHWMLYGGYENVLCEWAPGYLVITMKCGHCDYLFYKGKLRPRGICSSSKVIRGWGHFMSHYFKDSVSLTL